jgi:N6-L-threonylcarbamoyladenine synthase
MIVLGIETSCDETAVAVVDGERRILAERVLSQLAEHRPYGGVVPEIAARSHLDHLDRLVAETMAEARLDFPALAGVAATGGPGLIGGVIVGVMTGKAIAAVHNLPFVAVNHLEGHALTARLTNDVGYPYLLLLVSGGHCQLLVVEGVGRYRRLGTTLDDAAGEAFDKTAKLLGLGYPGGPALERYAVDGNPSRFDLPRPMVGRPGFGFSFSGLKTAVRQLVEATPPLDDAMRADIAATFQARVAESLADRTRRALKHCRQKHIPLTAMVIAGGVAANATIRATLTAVAMEGELPLVAPPPRLCTDNAAMIAWAGIERLRLGLTDGFDFAPRPRWPLDAGAADLADGAALR